MHIACLRKSICLLTLDTIVFSYHIIENSLFKEKDVNVETWNSITTFVVKKYVYVVL